MQNSLPSALLLVLTKAESRRINTFGWNKVKVRGGTPTRSLKQQRALEWLAAQSACIQTSNCFGFLSSNVDNDNLMKSTTSQSTKTAQSHKCKQVGERALARAKRVIDDKKTAARRLQQLEMEDVALNKAEVNASKTTRAEPTLNKSLMQGSLEPERNKGAKKRSKSNRLLQGAKQQHAIYLLEKYSNLKTKDKKRRRKSNFDSPLRKADRQQGIHMRDKCANIQTDYKAISYLRHPAKSKFKKLQA